MKILSVFFVLLMFPSAQAFISPAVELLNLPAENRKQILKMQGAQHITDLKALAFDRSQPMSIRWKALTSVAEVEGDSSIQILMKASEAPEWYMRNAALVTLQEVHQETAEKVASKLIQDKALVVRSAAIEVLKKLNSENVRDLFWTEMERPYNYRGTQSLWVRSMMLEHLAKEPRLSEKPRFEELSKDRDRKVQKQANLALSRLSLGLH